ncbi:MAG: tetratricopeptide repeat protein [Candidatus Obscuribacterales bacterium]|nr:tetratricopeptide repeat protein [Candidatus Obscuribacterales bacterium]
MDHETKQLLDELRDGQKRLALLLKKKTQDREKPKKDFWDRLGAIAPLISGLLIAGTGVYCSYSFNQQQLKLQEIQTIERFIPHLLGGEKSKQAAIMAMSSLTNTKVAAKMASLFASEGTVSALRTIAATGDTQDRTIATKAMSAALSNMAERYQEEERYEEAEQAYKKSLAIAEESDASENADASYSLERLAELYKMRGRYKEAEPLLKRALVIRRKAYGEKNLFVAETLKKLSELYSLQGKSKEAQTLLKEAVAIDSASTAEQKEKQVAESKPLKQEQVEETVAAPESKDLEPKGALNIEPAVESPVVPAEQMQQPVAQPKQQAQLQSQTTSMRHSPTGAPHVCRRRQFPEPKSIAATSVRVAE